MNHDFAVKWTKALSENVDDLSSMYADECIVEIGTYADAVGEAITNRASLRRELAQFSNRDSANGMGIHTFSAKKYEGHERHGIIQWDWTAEHLDAYRGMPVDGRTLSSVGQTFQQYDSDGKIVRESTYWNDVKVLKELGVPMEAAHYWEL